MAPGTMPRRWCAIYRRSELCLAIGLLLTNPAGTAFGASRTQSYFRPSRPPWPLCRARTRDARLDQMLDAFYRMVERQLSYPKTPDGWRRNAARIRHARNIPYALLGELKHIVALYGESLAVDPGCKTTPHLPVYWTAERLGTGERFACLIAPPAPPQEAMLRHWELTAEDFIDAVTLDEARDTWQAFQRPDDIVVVYNNGTARLREQLTLRPLRCIVLKSIDFNPQRRYSTLDELMAAEGLIVAPGQLPGRAGQRLANAVALIEHLRGLRNCDVT